jgi:O-antigen ligase
LTAVILVFACYYAAITTSRRLRMSALYSADGILALYGLAVVFRASSFISSISALHRLTNFYELPETRLIAWDIAWQGFLERPFTGWGFDSLHILFNKKYDPRSLDFGYYETWCSATIRMEVALQPYCGSSRAHASVSRLCHLRSRDDSPVSFLTIMRPPPR